MRTKLLVAFLGIAALLVLVALLGLRVLGQANSRAERLGALQVRVAGYQALLVFAYQLMPEAPLPNDVDDLWTWRGRRYLLRAVPVDDYRSQMRVRSPRWGTVTLPRAAFRELVKPLHHFTHHVRSLEFALES